MALLKNCKARAPGVFSCLSLVTVGIYTSYYIRRQTKIINRYHPGESGIPEGFAMAIIILAWLSLAMLVPYVLVEDGHPVESISNAMDKGWSLLAMIWAFMARKRMNSFLSSEKSDARWFSGIWTFFFNALYFNYKVNTIYESMPDRPVRLG